MTCFNKERTYLFMKLLKEYAHGEHIKITAGKSIRGKFKVDRFLILSTRRY